MTTTNDTIIASMPPIPEGSEFAIYRLESVNFKPHPFCITPRHVEYASKYCGGRLDEKACNAEPCGVGRPGSPIHGESPCNLSYHEHTHETAMLIKVWRDGSLQDVPGLHEWMKQAADVITAGKLKVDGFAFVKVSKPREVE